MRDGSDTPQHSNDRPASKVPLLDLTPGTLAVLHEILDQESRAVLRSLGLTDGSRMRICRVGDPCIIQVRSTRIGISKVVAQSVYVVPTDQEEGR